MRTALYPGTFDPITLGHRDIIERATILCDRLIIAVAENAGKNPLFSVGERASLIMEDLSRMTLRNSSCQVEVIAFDTLLVDFARVHRATLLIRGLRAVSDFEYEFQMAGINTALDPAIETVFLPTASPHQFIASSFIKEISRLKGNIHAFVSKAVAEKLFEKVS